MLAWILVHMGIQGICDGRDCWESGGSDSWSPGCLQSQQSKEVVQLDEDQVLVQKLFHTDLFARDHLDFGLLQQFRSGGAIHFCNIKCEFR